MELIFVRHALPLRREGSEGPADPPLAPEGWNQARKLAEWLRGEHIHGVIVSPSRRAYETAVPLAEMRGLEPVVDDALAEFDHGAASYVPFEELRKLGDARWEALSRGEFINTSVDPVEFRRRIVNRIEEIIARQPRPAARDLHTCRRHQRLPWAPAGPGTASVVRTRVCVHLARRGRTRR
jgi:probable phosphoglycerate mutase